MNEILTEEEIEAIAKKHIRICGDYIAYEEAIPERYIEDFARDIENAVLRAIKEEK